MPGPVVTDLFFYPIKSLAGIPVPRAVVTPQGLNHDRRYMLITQDGRFITQRQYPRMALLKAELIDPDTVRYRDTGGRTLDLPLTPCQGPSVAAQVWHDTVDATLAQPEYSDWFATALQIDCRLVAMGEQYRPLKPGRGQSGDTVSFADAAPILLTASASLDDLNTRLDQPVVMGRFRPNIVVRTNQAYVEDTWASLRVGSAHLDVGWSCSRCILTTVDPATGIRSEQRQPFATLKAYRDSPDGPLFGQNLIPRRLGTIAVRDEVEVKTAED